MLTIYYEYEPAIGINVTYDYEGERVYDYFSSLAKFNAWVSLEFHGAETVEITDSNYRQLVEQGLI